MADRVPDGGHLAQYAGGLMNMLPYITWASLKTRPTWAGVIDALMTGHQMSEARITDSLLERGAQRLLTRSAWIDGLGALSKTVTVYPGNPKAQPARPSVHGAATLFDDHTGAVCAVIDSDLLTWWKTAADSVLAARLLGPKDPEHLMIIGAGTVARSLVDAYSAEFPTLKRITICTRRAEAATIFVQSLTKCGAELVTANDPAHHAPYGDIVACATTSAQPVLHGRWLKPGVHIDLIGAYAPTMREADDAAITAGPLYVDSRATTLHHIGELMIPLAAGVISTEDVAGDFYDLCADNAHRPDQSKGRKVTTIFKNGGGAHLDLMVAHYLMSLHADV